MKKEFRETFLKNPQIKNSIKRSGRTMGSPGDPREQRTWCRIKALSNDAYRCEPYDRKN